MPTPPQRRLDRRRVLVGASAGVILAATAPARAGASGTAGASRSRTDRPLALVYRGPASSAGCPEAAANLLWYYPDTAFDVRFCGPHEGLKLTAKNLLRSALYVQPGGGQDVPAAWGSVRRASDAITEFVRGGGHYIGICMGGYLAGKGPGFDLLPGNSQGYITSPGATVKNADSTLVTVEWNGSTEQLFFQDGPSFQLDKGADATVLATYPNGEIAAMVARVGKGSVGVSGPHPEAPASWFTAAGLPIRTQFALGYQLLRTTLRS